MPITYYVQQGDYISSIAQANGFKDFQTIWDDPGNADLKKLRINPNTLLPGDAVVIPDKIDHQESAGCNARHTYQTRYKPLQLQLAILDESGKPVASQSVRLDVGGASNQLTTDAAGKVSLTIPNDTSSGKLVVKTDTLDLEIDLAVGELDPLEEVTGQIARLNNLGYDAGEVIEPGDDDATQQFKSAVEEFQCNSKITVDGICGPATQTKLKEIHGC